MNTEERNRIEAYHGLDITKKQYENCLYPLYVLGEGTTKDISDYTTQPINRVSGRFSECMRKGFVHCSFAKPTKKQDGNNCTNYVLTTKGKDIINEVQGNIQREAV